MANYKESFEIGIRAAEIAEANRAEILSVFLDLNIQLKEPTGGRIEIILAKLREPEHKFQISLFIDIPTYWAIAARNPLAESSVKEIAKWEQTKAGYPCTIKIGKDQIYCEDKLALQEGLAALLQDPAVGEILHNLMKLPVKKENSSQESGNQEDDSQDGGDQVDDA